MYHKLILRPCSSFASCLNDVFHSKRIQDRILYCGVSLVFHSLAKFLRFVLTFMTSTFLKTVGRLFHTLFSLPSPSIACCLETFRATVLDLTTRGYLSTLTTFYKGKAMIFFFFLPLLQWLTKLFANSFLLSRSVLCMTSLACDWFEPTLHLRNYINGKSVHEKVINIIHQYGNVN